MTATCDLCQRPVDGTAYVCQPCANSTADQLALAADVAPYATDAVNGLARYSRPGPRGHGEPPMLGQPDSRRRLAEARNAIVTWAHVVSGERGRPLPELGRPVAGPVCPVGWCLHDSCRAIRTRAGEHPVAAAARWLTGHVGWLRQRQYAAEALTGLTEAARTIVRGADRPPDQVIVGACECGTALYAIAGAATATCRACGARWDVQRSRDILRKHLDGMLATAAEIAVMALHLHPDARRHKVRHLINVWASRTQITRRGLSRDGSPTYRVGEVLARLDPLLSRPEREAS